MSRIRLLPRDGSWAIGASEPVVLPGDPGPDADLAYVLDPGYAAAAVRPGRFRRLEGTLRLEDGTAPTSSSPRTWLPRPPVVRERPNVVLITIDTLRPDRLGPYGYDRATSPPSTGSPRRAWCSRTPSRAHPGRAPGS